MTPEYLFHVSRGPTEQAGRQKAARRQRAGVLGGGGGGGQAVSCAKRVEAIEGECIHCVLCDFNCLFLFYLWSLALVHSLQRAVRSPSRSWHHDMVRHHHKSQLTLFVCSSLITQRESQQVLAECLRTDQLSKSTRRLKSVLVLDVQVFSFTGLRALGAFGLVNILGRSLKPV